MAAKIVALKSARTHVLDKPPLGTLIDFAGGVQDLAADLALFRLALFGAVEEAASLREDPILRELMAPIIGQAVRLEEKGLRLSRDANGVAGDVYRSLRPGRRE